MKRIRKLSPVLLHDSVADDKRDLIKIRIHLRYQTISNRALKKFLATLARAIKDLERRPK